MGIDFNYSYISETFMKKTFIALGIASVVGLSGCSSNHTTSTPSISSVGTASSIVTPADTSSTAPLSVDSGSPSAANPNGDATDSKGTESSSPAPTTAGDLNSKSIPSVSGFTPRAGDGDDGSYVPNGQSTHAIDPDQAIVNAVSQRCNDADSNFPHPVSVLGGSFTDADKNNVNTTTYEFKSPADATSFVQVYKAGLNTCTSANQVMTVTMLDGGSAILDTRVYPNGGAKWSEIVKPVGNKVQAILIQNDKGTVTNEKLKAIADSLN